MTADEIVCSLANYKKHHPVIKAGFAFSRGNAWIWKLFYIIFKLQIKFIISYGETSL